MSKSAEECTLEDFVVAIPNYSEPYGSCTITAENGDIIVSCTKQKKQPGSYTRVMKSHLYKLMKDEPSWRTQYEHGLESEQYMIRNYSVLSPTLDDAICSIGKDLLAAGYWVRFPNIDLKEKTERGEYVSDASKYILPAKKTRFKVVFPVDDQTYDHVMSVIKQKEVFNHVHDNRIHTMEVNGKAYKKIMKLEEKYGFHIGDEARQRISVCEAKYAGTQADKNKYDSSLQRTLVRFNPNKEDEAAMAEYLATVDSRAGKLKEALYEYMQNHNIIMKEKRGEI